MAAEAVDIDRKLRLTAAYLGARTRKDLAAAFHRANPRTSFDIERANKWLQGRARPRERQIYEDWAAVLGVGRDGAWIADCPYAAFLAAIAAAAGLEQAVLERRARAFAGEPPRGLAEPPAAARFQGDLAGSYLCYSPAWSSYFAGRLIRGILAVERLPAGGFTARYTQSRVQDSITATGEVEVLQRGVLMFLREPHRRTAFLFSLFPPMSLVSVLGGIISGVAVLGADPQPSASRVVMVRMPGAVPDLPLDCLLEPGASVTADLAVWGAPVAEAVEAERRIASCLAVGIGPTHDPQAFAAHRAVVEVFDREWIRHGFPAG